MGGGWGGRGGALPSLPCTSPAVVRPHTFREEKHLSALCVPDRLPIHPRQGRQHEEKTDSATAATRKEEGIFLSSVYSHIESIRQQQHLHARFRLLTHIKQKQLLTKQNKQTNKTKTLNHHKHVFLKYGMRFGRQVRRRRQWAGGEAVWHFVFSQNRREAFWWVGWWSLCL